MDSRLLVHLLEMRSGRLSGRLRGWPSDTM